MPSRRAVLAGAAGAAGLGVGAAVGYRPGIDAWTPPSDAWPLADYDPAGTAHAPGTNAPEDPVVAWTKRPLTRVYRTGLVAGPDRVYVAGAGVAALDRTDGSTAWTADGGGPAAFVDGTLFVAPGEGLGSGRDQRVRAFDAAGGDRRWAEPSVSEAASAVYADGSLYLGTEAGVTAVDADGGGERWTVVGFYEAMPLVAGGRLYATGGRESGETARFRNRRLLDGTLARPPEREWETPHEGYPLGFAAADGTVVVGYHLSEPGETPATAGLDPETGATVWRVPAPGESERGPVRGGPVALADGRCVAGLSHGDDDAVTCRRLDDGEELWRVDVDGHVTDLVVSGDTAIVGTENGVVRALSLSDGTDRWRVDVTLRVHAIAAVDGTVFVATRGGRVYALR